MAGCRAEVHRAVKSCYSWGAARFNDIGSLEGAKPIANTTQANSTLASSTLDRLRQVLGRLMGRAKRPHAPLAGKRPYPWEASYPEGLSWDLAIDPQPLHTLLNESVAAYPERPCLDFLGKNYSYKEVGALTDRIAAGLQALGIGKGDRVGLFLPNSAYYVLSYYGILKAGATVVNFNPLYAELGIVRQIKDSRIKIMVTLNLESLYPKIAEPVEKGDLERVVVCSMAAALPFPASAFFSLFKRKEVSAIPEDDNHIRFEKLAATNTALTIPEIDPEKDVAVLQYTGGTTGTPKGAMLTHANLYANTIQTRVWAMGAAQEQEKILAVLPLFHVFGMTALMNVGLMTASEIILLPRFKLAEVLKVIDKQKPTLFCGVPTMYSAINASPASAKIDLSCLRYCISGGAPLPPTIKADFEELTGCGLVEGYGLSETSPVCTINPIGGLNKEGSAGLPVPATIVEITALDDPDRVLPLGEPGEICVSGPQVMTGYAGRPEESAQVLRNDRLYTGDVGYMDDEGYLFIIDRIKDLIITGGFNVYPRMVEEAILLHPAIQDVAACGVPSKHHGEIVKAYITLKPGVGLSVADLRTYLKDKLAPFETPRRIEFTDQIPKTMLGKPLRRELVARELERDAKKAAKAGKAKKKKKGAKA